MTNGALPPKQLEQSKGKRKISDMLPFSIKLIYASAAVCVVLYAAFLLSEGFSDFFNKYVSSGLRAILSHITGWIPFSVAEFVLILLPLWVILICRVLMKRFGDTWKDFLCSITCVFSALALVFTIFTVGFAPAYRGSTLDKKLGIERADVSAQDLYNAALTLSSLIDSEVENIVYESNGFSVMPYNVSIMNDKLIAAYSSVCDEYSFVQHLNSNIKPILLSKPMSYTHITGVYTFFTGEANINVDFPDYTLPFTAAHELSHQRGIAREDEANFMAFLVCAASDDAYIRYSAYLNLYEYVAAALSKADRELYVKTFGSLPFCVKGELEAYSEFYAQYENSSAAKISGAINNTFLTLHGTQGTASYGMVVDLAVAYFKQK